MENNRTAFKMKTIEDIDNQKYTNAPNTENPYIKKYGARVKSRLSMVILSDQFECFG